MRLWKLAKRVESDPTGKIWGSCRAFVIREENEEDARRRAYYESSEYGSIGDNSTALDITDAEVAWLDPLLTTCEELLPNGDPSVIVRDYFES